MNIGELKISKIQILVSLVLLLGIIIGVYLVQRQHIFKSRADEYDAFQVIGADCSGHECRATDKNIKIRIDKNKLEQIINE